MSPTAACRRGAGRSSSPSVACQLWRWQGLSFRERVDVWSWQETEPEGCVSAWEPLPGLRSFAWVNVQALRLLHLARLRHFSALRHLVPYCPCGWVCCVTLLAVGYALFLLAGCTVRPGNQFERFRGGFLELIIRFEFDFRRRGIFFLTIRIFGVFKVQSHTMWPYMCVCCGLFVPTQFHFECCGVRDDS